MDAGRRPRAGRATARPARNGGACPAAACPIDSAARIVDAGGRPRRGGGMRGPAGLIGLLVAILVAILIVRLAGIV